MKRRILFTTMLLAAGSIGIACAQPNLVNNGDFSQTSPAPGGPWQFGANSGSGAVHGGASCTYGGQFITGWTGNTGYEFWYPDANAAATVEPCSQFPSETQLLSPIDPTPAGSGSFVGLDGINDSHFTHASISQTINGLTPGEKYTVSFYWGSTQLQNREGPTTEYLQVSLGSQSQNTVTNSIGTHGWSGWAPVSMTFVANSPSEILSFLSVGTPNSLPPFAVLANVSMAHNVPEPPGLALFGGGLLGLGLLTVLARRRALRQRRATDKA